MNSGLEDYRQPVFFQLNMFAGEVLRLIDEGHSLEIDEICRHIEAGDIVEFVNNSYGFLNMNVTIESIHDVNDALKESYVSKNKAMEVGINNNGLICLVYLILGNATRDLFNLYSNDIEPDDYRDKEG